MKNGKRAVPDRHAAKRQSKSRGATWAEQTRAQCNKLTSEEREKLLERAMQIAYGTEAEPAVARRR